MRRILRRRQVKMDPELTRQIRKAMDLPEGELRMRIASQADWTPQKIAAQIEMERRGFWRQFLLRDFVAWLALAISVLALVVGLVN